MPTAQVAVAAGNINEYSFMSYPTRTRIYIHKPHCIHFLVNSIFTTCIYGGVEKGPQKQAFRDGVHVVVATPGRLKDLIEEGMCVCLCMYDCHIAVAYSAIGSV